VPAFGAEYVNASEALTGTDTQVFRLRAGVPWPPRWPWQGRESSAPFLTLDLTRERVEAGPGIVSLRHSVGLTAELNREMEAVVRWTRAEPTPLEIIHGLGTRDRVEISIVYAFAR
jgi:hypothetical protein